MRKVWPAAWRKSAPNGASAGSGGLRRRLLLLAGLGAAAAAEAVRAPARALAAGYVVGAPPGYSPLDAPADGVQGYATGANAAGVFGRNNDLNGVGVHGTAPAGVGVHGESTSGTGVGARSSSGYGVFGTSTSGHAVHGASTQGYGVVGVSTSGHGVQGTSTQGYGVVGVSTSNNGVWGESQTAGVAAIVGRNPSGTGLWADTSATNMAAVVGYHYAAGYGLWGQSTSGIAVVGHNPSGQAALFVGNVQIQGSLTVTGGYPKSASVPHPDGSQRRMYCQESPEPWFEDFGQATLANGRASVRLDADFAAVVRADDYLVFLTELDGHNALYVAARTPTGFDVRADKAGAAGGAFCYRVVARRKDVAPARLERVEVPSEATINGMKPDPSKARGVGPREAADPGDGGPGFPPSR